MPRVLRSTALYILFIPLWSTDLSARAVHLISQGRRVLGLINHFLGVDSTLGVHPPEMVIEQLHAELFSCLDR